MKFPITVLALALIGWTACEAPARAQARNPKFNTKRFSLISTSQSQPTPTPAAPRTRFAGPVTRPVTHVMRQPGATSRAISYAAPACGCDVAPSCGCDAAPACGCDVASACGYRRGCLPPLIPALMHGVGSVLDAILPCHGGCGYDCPVYPVPPCHAGPRRVGLLPKLGWGPNGCGPVCGCEPSCGLGPSHGSGVIGPGTIYYDNEMMPLGNPFEDDETQEMLSPPAPPEEARHMRPRVSPRGHRFAPASHAVDSRGARPRSTSAPSSSTAGRYSVIKRTSHSEQAALTPATLPARSGVESGANIDIQRAPRPLNAYKTTTLRRDIGGQFDVPAPQVAAEPRATSAIRLTAAEQPVGEASRPAELPRPVAAPRPLREVPVNPLRPGAR